MKIPQSLSNKQAVLRRAIIRINPDYFSWPSETQEKYRCSLSYSDNFDLQRFLLKSLFNIEVNTDDELNTVFNSFNDEEYLIFNSTFLPLTGIGKDCFHLNEIFVDNKTLLDFETLYDYDYDNHCYQEAYWEKSTDYQSKPYQGRLFGSWVRIPLKPATHST